MRVVDALLILCVAVVVLMVLWESRQPPRVPEPEGPMILVQARGLQMDLVYFVTPGVQVRTTRFEPGSVVIVSDPVKGEKFKLDWRTPERLILSAMSDAYAAQHGVTQLPDVAGLLLDLGGPPPLDSHDDSAA